MLLDELHRAIEQLLGRAEGPLYIRLLIQPVVASLLAVRAGLRDARENKPPFLWDLLTNRAQRKDLIKTAWKDLRRLLITAFLLDFFYQVFVLKSFYLLQVIIVTMVLALLPYVILRGLVTRIWRGAKSDR